MSAQMLQKRQRYPAQEVTFQGKHVTVHLINGVRLSGRVRSFDKHSVVLETATLDQLVFKHSISAAFICANKHCAECYPDQISPALRT